MTVTLASLRTQARQRADMENSNFVTDSELNQYINSSIAELHDLFLSQPDSDYNVMQYTFSIVDNQDQYDLPADFYKLRGVDLALNQGASTRYLTLKPFNFNERNRNSDLPFNFIWGPALRYRLVGNKIVFTPIPSGSYSIQLWYVPLAQTLSADGDILNDLNAFSEYVVVDAAIKMRLKEESDVTILEKMKSDMRARIIEMSQNRDAGASDTISDVQAENQFFDWTRTW